MLEKEEIKQFLNTVKYPSEMSSKAKPFFLIRKLLDWIPDLWVGYAVIDHEKAVVVIISENGGYALYRIDEENLTLTKVEKARFLFIIKP